MRYAELREAGRSDVSKKGFEINRENVIHVWDRMMNLAQSYTWKAEDGELNPATTLLANRNAYVDATGDKALPAHLDKQASGARPDFVCILAAIYRVGSVLGKTNPKTGEDVARALVAYMPTLYRGA